MKYFKYCRYLLPFWKKEVMALSLTGAGMLLGLVNPYLTKLVIDQAYGQRNLKLFIILIAIGSAIFVLSGIISGLVNYLNRYIRLRVSFHLNRKVYIKLQRLPYGFFQDSSTGENLYKINYDIDAVTQLITGTLPELISTLLRALFILAVTFFLNWKMTLFALLLMPFSFITYYYIQRMRKALKGLIQISQDIFKHLQEALAHMQLIKAFGKENYQIRQYIRNLIEKIRINLKNSKIEITGSFVNSLANRVIFGLITFYGGYQLIKGQLTLGSLSAITIYLSQLSGLQSTFAQFLLQLNSGFFSCERLDTILNAQTPVVIEDKDAKEISFSQGSIEFRDATFGYQQDKPVLENLSFSITGGSCIALVGHSGCGKTTIVNLILRLYNLNNGQILIDGFDSRSVKSKSLYGQIGVVLQEPYLWNDTIGNNIKYGREDANLEELTQAANIACIDDFINVLPQGLNSIIGENACKISEGQKQRIAIARAVIKRPKILILDEALSSVDAQIEANIIDNIRASLKSATLIIISHRFSAIKRTDLVFFLNSHKKIDIGSHEELINNNVEYQNYLSHQLREEKWAVGRL